MKHSFFLSIVCVLCIGITVRAQQSVVDRSAVKKYAFLLGDWEGEGNGQPGEGKGYFSFVPELDGRIIVRKNHAEFPATPQKAAFVHDDRLIIYADRPGDMTKALLMDNEDHTIHYNVTFSDDQKSIVFTSDVTPGMPTFRLTYTQLEANRVNIKFELAPPGKPNAFNVYLEGKAHRK